MNKAQAKNWFRNWGPHVIGGGLLLIVVQVLLYLGALKSQLETSFPNIQKIPALEKQVDSYKAAAEKLPIIESNTNKIPLLEKRVTRLSTDIDTTIIPSLNRMLEKQKLPQVPPLREDVSAVVKQELQKERENWQPALISALSLKVDVGYKANHLLAGFIQEWQTDLERRQPTVKPELNAVVRDGILYLDGVVSSVRQRDAVEKAFRGLPVKVENRIVVEVPQRAGGGSSP